MEAKPKYAKPRSLSVLMALRILFLLGFLFGCLFARTSQIAMAPVSGSVWFRGPFETGTDFPFVFSAFLFDSLFYCIADFFIWHDVFRCACDSRCDNSEGLHAWHVAYGTDPA